MWEGDGMTKNKDKDLFKGWTDCSSCGMRIPPNKECPICNNDGSMKKAAVVIDKYKLKTFVRVLSRDGFEFVKDNGLTSDTIILYVMTNNPSALKRTIQICETKYRELRN